jgi:CBS domain-containing protein
VAETLVRDIMDANPQTVREDTPVQDVIRLLRDNELPGVPVVNEGGRCVGIVTENDLVISDDEGDLHLPHYIELFGGIVFLEPLQRFEDRLRKAFASKAGDMMTRDPVTVAPDTTVREAAHVIAEEGHNRLPVAEHGRLVGVVTRVDVLSALATSTRD